MHQLAPEKDPASDGKAQVLCLRSWKELGVLSPPSNLSQASTSIPGSNREEKSMDQTIILLTIEHKKPLPKDAAKVIEQRFYMWAYSQGVEVGVRATVLPVKNYEVWEEK